MRVGIGLPTRADGLSPDGLLDWARRAGAGPFTSLVVLDRVVFPAHEPLIALASVIGVTSRIPTTPAALRSVLDRQAAMGVDEFILRPCTPDPSLIDRLTDIVGGLA